MRKGVRDEVSYLAPKSAIVTQPTGPDSARLGTSPSVSLLVNQSPAAWASEPMRRLLVRLNSERIGQPNRAGSAHPADGGALMTDRSRSEAEKSKPRATEQTRPRP